MKRVLLIRQHSYNKWEYPDGYIEKIRQLGYEVYVHPKEDASYSKEELACEVFANTFAFAKVPVKEFANLKYVQGLSAGYEHFPLEEFKERGIMLCNAKGIYGVPIAECILSSILNVYKKNDKFLEQKENRIFKRDPSLMELSGKTALIFGTGDIGTQTAKRLQAFEVKTIGINRSARKGEYFDEVYSMDNWQEHMMHADFVIVTLPLSDITYHLIDENFLQLLKENSIFVNVGRGSVVKESALTAFLQKRQDVHAVLDVFEEEPLPEDSPLWSLVNVSLYPHTMTGSDNAYERMKDLVYRNLKAYIENKDLENVIFK